MADYSIATNLELYKIAIDESIRMVERYEAVREMLRRKCKNEQRENNSKLP
jgi:hypothetical protein